MHLKFLVLAMLGQNGVLGAELWQAWGQKKGGIGEFLRGSFGDKFELASGGFYGTLENV